MIINHTERTMIPGQTTLLVLTFIKEALMKSESGTPSREERWTLEWSSDTENSVNVKQEVCSNLDTQ